MEKRLIKMDSRSRSPSPTECNSIGKEPQESSYISSEQNDRIVINVGGCRHETFRSTLRIFPDTRLGWIAIKGKSSIDAYDPIRDEYFFDRHPHAFSQIINYYRTGKLHAPSDICGPMFEAELSYWGLDEKIMEPCCWSKYTEHRDAEENLKVFDNHMLRPPEEHNVQELYYFEDKGTNAMIESLSSATWNKHKTSRFFRFKKKVWFLFEKHNSCLAARIISMISLIFILLSVLSLCFHSILELATPNQLYSDLLLSLDIASFVWFSMELFLRFLSAPNKASFLMNAMNLIDFIVIIPYVGHFASLGRNDYIKKRSLGKWNREWFHIFAIARLFRLFRFFRLSTGLQILKHTLIASSKELLLLLLLLAIPVAIFATIVFYCENASSEGTKFKTIPESFWWAVVTMTTVGYGDIVPTTTIGKFFGVLCALCGVLIIALPVSIIGNNFKLFYHYAQARLKQPIQHRSALVGAANALVSESTHQTIGSVEEPDAPIYPSTPNIFKDISQSKRFQRERSSLYITSHTQKISPRRALSETFTTNRPDTAYININKTGKNIQRVMEKSHTNGGFSSNDSINKINCLSQYQGMNSHNSDKSLDSKTSSVTSSGFCTIPMAILSPCENVDKIIDESSDLQEVLSKSQKSGIGRNLEGRNGSNLKTELNFRAQNLSDFHSKEDFEQNKIILYKDNRKRSNNHLYVPEPEGLHELIS